MLEMGISKNGLQFKNIRRLDPCLCDSPSLSLMLINWLPQLQASEQHPKLDLRGQVQNEPFP